MSEMTVFRIRIIYLLMYMAFAFWRVYYNVYLEENGLSGSEIGILNALMQSTFFIIVPIWGIVADRVGIRPTLKWLVIASAVCVFLLANITSFWLLLIFIPFLTIFYHPLGPLNDALAIQFAVSDEKHSFGSFRLWGSLGWALASIIGGIVFIKLPIKYTFIISACLFLILSVFLITHKRKKIYKPHFQSISVKELLANRPLLIFIFIITFYGIACSPVNSYLNLYFKELKAGNNIIGYAYAIMAFSELPFFIIGNRLLKTFGARKVMSIAMIAMIIRMIFYGLVPNVYLSLAIGALQGISLSFFLVGAVEYLHRLMPSGRHATSQSIIWATYTGIGQTVGNLLIGPLIDRIGMTCVMQFFALVNITCFSLAGWYFQRQKKSENGILS